MERPLCPSGYGPEQHCTNRSMFHVTLLAIVRTPLAPPTPNQDRSNDILSIIPPKEIKKREHILFWLVQRKTNTWKSNPFPFPYSSIFIFVLWKKGADEGAVSVVASTGSCGAYQRIWLMLVRTQKIKTGKE